MTHNTHLCCLPTWQGVANRDIKLENTLLDGSPRPLIKVQRVAGGLAGMPWQ